jgi:hypothetical protein
MATILKKDAKKMLAKVPEENVFWCRDGRIVKNMRELEKALTSMADETYTYHSNGAKADFSNWVKDVIGDEKLAKDLGKAPDRTQAAKSVTSRISFLDKKLAQKTRS